MNGPERLGAGRGRQVIYPQPLVRWIAPGEVELTDVQPGPAGGASVSLPDGTFCEVDHAAPHQLVQLTMPDSTPPRVVRHWVGERDTESGGSSSHGDDRWLDQPTRRPAYGSREAAARRRRGAGDAAVAVGRAVLAADLLDDAELPPVVRLTSGAELYLALEQDPAVEALEPLRPQVRQRIEQLANWVDEDDLAELGRESSQSLIRLLRQLTESLQPRSVPLEHLLANVRRVQEWFERPGDALQAYAPSDDEGAFEPPHRAAAAAWFHDDVTPDADAPADFLDIQRLEPALLRVTVSRAAPGDWVRVLREDGLVLLAAAPFSDDWLRPAGRLLRSAELIVPPDTLDDELVVQVVDADDVDRGPQTADLIRDAVRVGRHAARAERLGRGVDAHDRWTECSSLWDRAGDEHRALLARRRAAGGVRPAPVGALLCDELAEDLLVSGR